jgi:hypothetical protein
VAPVTVPVAAARIVLAVGQGAGQQDWQEERDGPFNNVYEESKWMAEHLLGERATYTFNRVEVSFKAAGMNY